MKPIRVTLVLIYVVLLASVAQAQARYYGAIDLGSKGVKGTLYSFVREGKALDEHVILKKTINTKLVSSMSGTRFTPDGIQDAVAAVQGLLEEMRAEALRKKIENIKYYVIASSGVANSENKDELAAAVKKATGLEMDYVDAHREGYLGLKSFVPRDDQATAVYVDIGSGNTKLGCLVGEPISKNFKSTEIPYGSVTGRNAAVKLNPENMRAGVERVMKEQVQPAYAKQSMDIPCLRNRRSIYWTGGAAWATATMMHPEKALSSYVRITRKDLDTFLAQLADGTWNQKSLHYVFPKGTSKDWQAKTRTRGEAERNDLMNTFVAEDLLSGVSIMKAVLESSNPSAEIFFARSGNYVYGYALEKYAEDRELARAESKR